MVDRGHPVVAVIYNPLMALQDAAGLRKQRLRATGAATGRVLEVGIGTGWNLPFYRNAAEVVGVEADPHMLRRARRMEGRAPCPVTLIEGDAEHLAFGDGEFDTVLFSLSLCTILDPRAALAEAHRVLKPDGQLVFLEHTRSPKPGHARFQDRITPLWKRVAGGCHPNRPTVDTIEQAGFEVTSLWRARDGKGVIVQGLARPRTPLQ
jgi:ubiquinone/menaquinone biosynthesis C-methylase UbiE